MGIGHALFEEVTFNESGITTEDWHSYPIPNHGDIPEIQVLLLHNPEVGAYGGGSESAMHGCASDLLRRSTTRRGRSCGGFRWKPGVCASGFEDVKRSQQGTD